MVSPLEFVCVCVYHFLLPFTFLEVKMEVMCLINA